MTSTGPPAAAVSSVSAGASSGSPALGNVTTVRACGPRLQGAQLLCGYLQLGVDRVGGGEQDPAGVGEGDAARAALHEHGARAAFEGGDLLGHRRRRVVQHRGRPGEAARARDLPQDGQAMRVNQQFS